YWTQERKWENIRIPGGYIDTVPLYIDCNSALKLTRNPEFHNKSKHIDVKHHFVREKLAEGLINTQRVNTKDNLADVFTKALPRSTADCGDRTRATSSSISNLGRGACHCIGLSSGLVTETRPSSSWKYVI
ncbi:hypothetical protein PENSUB_5509, partial [Penicillium subrubescens]